MAVQHGRAQNYSTVKIERKLRTRYVAIDQIKMLAICASGEVADESNGSSVGEPLDAKDRVTVPSEVDRAVEKSSNRTDGENRNQLPISTNEGSAAHECNREGSNMNDCRGRRGNSR